MVQTDTIQTHGKRKDDRTITMESILKADGPKELIDSVNRLINSRIDIPIESGGKTYMGRVQGLTDDNQRVQIAFSKEDEKSSLKIAKIEKLREWITAHLKQHQLFNIDYLYCIFPSYIYIMIKDRSMSRTSKDINGNITRPLANFFQYEK